MDYKYWAFISYSSKDAATAKKLHRRLETYRIPSDLVGRPGRTELVPKKIFPIFYDREELPLSANLGVSIEKALRTSRYLVIICSPHAAKSRWVNEEIRFFKSLGREDRVFAVIIDGMPNALDDEAANSECFPAALRYRIGEDGLLTNQLNEPLAGDLRKSGDGWTKVVLKALSGITGMGLDAFARRQQKRDRNKRFAIASLALLILVSGLWIWDYSRLKLTYFANISTKWGVPEGVGKLDAKARFMREHHYQIESRKRKVRRVVRVNSMDRMRDDSENYNASIEEIHYSEDGSLQRIDLLDHNGKIVLRKKFEAPKKSSVGKAQDMVFMDKYQNAPFALASTSGTQNISDVETRANKSEITVHRLIYNAHGQVGEIIYLNTFKFPKSNADGVFGKRFSYSTHSLPTRIENLNSDGNPFQDRVGLQTVEMLYNHLGDIKQLAYFTANNSTLLL